MGFQSKEKTMIKAATAKMPSVLTLSQSEETCADVAQAIADMLQLIVESHVLDSSNTADLLNDFPKTDFIVLDVGAGSVEEVALLERLHGEREKAIPPIVALLDRGSELGPVRAMRAGAADVLLRPIDAVEANEVFLRLRDAQRVMPLFPGRTASGKMIAFLHVSGGVGATTLAVNSAIALTSSSGKDRTCLIDLDSQFGAAGSLLDLSRSSRVEDFIAGPSRLDGEMLKTLAVSHKSGLRVLTAPRYPLPLDALNKDGVLHLCNVAKSSYLGGRLQGKEGDRSQAKSRSATPRRRRV